MTYPTPKGYTAAPPIAGMKAAVVDLYKFDVCEPRGNEWYVVGYWHNTTLFMRHGEGTTPDAAWADVARALAAKITDRRRWERDRPDRGISRYFMFRRR